MKMFRQWNWWCSLPGEDTPWRAANIGAGPVAPLLVQLPADVPGKTTRGGCCSRRKTPHSHFAPLWNLTFQTNKYFFKFSNIETSILAHYKQACNFIKNCSIFGAVYWLRDTCIREMVVFIVLMWHSACLHFLVLSFPTATLCVFSLGTLGF